MIETPSGYSSTGDADSVSIDKVVIQGAEFTRVADRYLLQSEVEQALAHARTSPAPHVERLTTLLEDIVNAADAVALEVVEAQSAVPAVRPWSGEAGSEKRESGSRDEAARMLLHKVREGLHEQLTLIDTFMQRLDG